MTAAVAAQPARGRSTLTPLPVVRTVGPVLGGHRLTRLAALMLATSVVGILAGLVVGDPRLVVAEDALVSAAIVVAAVVSGVASVEGLTALVRKEIES